MGTMPAAVTLWHHHQRAPGSDWDPEPAPTRRSAHWNAMTKPGVHGRLLGNVTPAGSD